MGSTHHVDITIAISDSSDGVKSLRNGLCPQERDGIEAHDGEEDEGSVGEEKE